MMSVSHTVSSMQFVTSITYYFHKIYPYSFRTPPSMPIEVEN